MRIFVLSIVAQFLFMPLWAFAHMPILVNAGEPVLITDPERSYAFYDTLEGEARSYRIMADSSWKLYINLLVPRDMNASGRYDAVIVNESTGLIVANLEGRDVAWAPYYEEFGADNYLRGPELRKDMSAGNYTVIVMGPGNVGAYTLAIGERESFTFAEAVDVVALMPTLKRDFFGVSPVTFVLSPYGGIYALFMLGVGGLLAFIVRRFLARRLGRVAATTPSTNNIGLHDRSLRAALGLALLLIAVLSTWHPILFIAAGFSFYQATAKWCVVFALLGKRTCPVE